MVVKRRYSLFEVFGVELEYMVVDRTTLAVRPLVDRLFFDMTGNWTADVDNGDIAWSNELVNHVVEFKTNGPAPALEGLAERFHANVLQLNDRLAFYGAQLLPSGAHPLMDPFTETVLWPHEYSDVYRLYNRIFDCRGHGWANLQSTHLNLPFRNDDEFGPLHAATRVLLPILPALSASTPLLDGALTGYADSRLETYRHNQERIPSIAGQVIPEAVFTRAAYYERIFQPIRNDIRPFDTDNLLDQHFLNSRGAIARFDRGALEIRVLDLQEAPLADLAILSLDGARRAESLARKRPRRDLPDGDSGRRTGPDHQPGLPPSLRHRRRRRRRRRPLATPFRRGRRGPPGLRPRPPEAPPHARHALHPHRAPPRRRPFARQHPPGLPPPGRLPGHKHPAPLTHRRGCVFAPLHVIYMRMPGLLHGVLTFQKPRIRAMPPLRLLGLAACLLCAACTVEIPDTPDAPGIPAPQYTLTADQTHNRFSRSIPPALRVPDGAVIEAFTREASDGQLTPASTVETVGALDFDPIHPLTGPVYVEGAEPGDVLAVTLHRIEVGDYGWAAIVPGFGFLADEFTEPYLKTFTLGKDATEARFNDAVTIPLRPFAGVMGVAPPTDEMLSTIPPRANGGNMDNPDLTEGVTVYFPVFVEGALFSIGDTHAAQGHGEVSGTAIEAPMRIVYEVHVVKGGHAMQEPQYETDDDYAVTAFAETLDEAARKATRYMIDYLADVHGFTRPDAYVLASLAADLKIAEVVDVPNVLVTMHLPKRVLPQR